MSDYLDTRHGYRDALPDAAEVLAPRPLAKAEPTVLGVPVSVELLDQLEAVSLACAARGISLGQWYVEARAAVAK